RVEVLLEIGICLTERIGFGGVSCVRSALIGSGKRSSHHPVFDGCPWRQQDIVLVHTHHVRSLCAQYANDLERHIPYPDFLAYGRFSAEQLSYDCLPDHTYFINVQDIMLGEWFTTVQLSPVPNVKK